MSYELNPKWYGSEKSTRYGGRVESTPSLSPLFEGQLKQNLVVWKYVTISQKSWECTCHTGSAELDISEWPKKYLATERKPQKILFKKWNPENTLPKPDSFSES